MGGRGPGSSGLLQEAESGGVARGGVSGRAPRTATIRQGTAVAAGTALGIVT